MRSKPVIAIDGPSGAGKSTVAKGVAKALNFSLIDTGALYRSIAWLGDQAGVDWEDACGLAELAVKHEFEFDVEGNLSVDGEPVGSKIREHRISTGASTVSKHPEVREALLTIQRSLGTDGGIVLEGRDIGTVVFPDAELKFFVDASAKIRAKRRHKELQERGEDIPFEQVLEDQERRDEADRNRKIAPLRKAEDATLVNCDNLTAAEATGEILSVIRASFPLTYS